MNLRQMFCKSLKCTAIFILYLFAGALCGAQAGPDPAKGAKALAPMLGERSPSGVPGKAWLDLNGLIARSQVAEMRAKVARYPWARNTLNGIRASVEPWMSVSMERLRELTPKSRTNVYHDFTCPIDHTMLTYNAFNDRDFKCPKCGRTYPPDGHSNVYGRGDPYYGTYYDGWGCLYLRDMSNTVSMMGVLYAVTGEERYARRVTDILLLMAAASRAPDGQRRRLSRDLHLQPGGRRAASSRLRDRLRAGKHVEGDLRGG